MTKTILTFFVVLVSASLAQAATVAGQIRVDNYHQLYSGDAAGAITEQSAGVVSGPGVAGSYSFTASDEYVYLIAWGDDAP